MAGQHNRVVVAEFESCPFVNRDFLFETQGWLNEVIPNDR